MSAGGLIDGPSAGALLTSGMLAAMTGVDVDPSVTMTGTVNPDGSVGPVGGIPQKMRAAADKGKKVIGYPIGSRYSQDLQTGQMVDLNAVAADKGVQAREMKDIYDAYQLLTGKSIARPAPVDVGEMEVSSKAFTRLSARAGAWLEKARSSATLQRAQKRPLRELEPIMQMASHAFDHAERYRKQGMVPVAYVKSVEAAVGADVAQRLTTFARMSMERNFDGLLAETRAMQSVEADFAALMARLETEEPKTAAGAMTLLDAYAQTIDAWAYASMASADLADLEQILSGLEQGKVPEAWKPRLQQAGGGARNVLYMLLVEKMVRPTLFYLLASYQLETARDVLESGGDEGTPVKLDPAALDRLARTYTSAAKANLDYYDSLILAHVAERSGASLQQVQAAKAAQDLQYLMAMKLSQYALETRDKKGISPTLARLAASAGSYLGAAQLVTAEYSLGVEKDKAGEPIEVKADKAFIAMLDAAELKAREQARAAKAASGIIPGISQIEYQVGRALREGDVKEKLQALGAYWTSSVASQLAVFVARAGKPSSPAR